MIALKLQEAFRMGKTMVYFGSMPKLPQVLSSDNAGVTNISFFQIIGKEPSFFVLCHQELTWSLAFGKLY